MLEFKESKFYKLLQDFFINNDKETFIQMLAEFYNRTEGIIIKNDAQDEIIKELREMYIKFNEEGIDDNIVREKVEYFIENSNKIQNILLKLSNNENKFKNINTQIEDIKSKNIKINGINKLFTKLNNNIPATIVCLGDSTTQGINVSPNFPNLVDNYFKNTLGYGDLVTTINAGVGGDTTIKGLSRLVPDVINKKPDLVIICFGINDVETKRDYKESVNDYRNIIKQLLTYCEKGLDIIVRTPNLNRNLSKINNFVEYNKLVEGMVREFGVQFADYNLYMREQNYTQEEMNTFTYDDIHPNVLGYEKMFNYMKQFFVKSTINKNNDYNLTKIELTSPNVNSTLSPIKNENYYGGYYLGQGGVAKIEIKFVGNEVNIPFSKSPSGGKVKISLDGNVIEDAYDLYYPQLVWQSIYTIKNIEDKQHILSIEILSDKNPQSSGTNCLMGGLTCKSYMSLLSENYNTSTNGNIETSYKDNIYVIKDTITGVTYQGGFASCEKNGWIDLKIPYKGAYNVICTQSGGGGTSNPTYENIYFTSGNDYELNRFRPNWDSSDTKKGINWIAIGV